MLKQKYFLTGIFILSAERQPIKLAWRKIVWLPNALDYLSKAIKDDNLLKYSVRDWPAFENCKNDNRYQRIIGIA